MLSPAGEVVALRCKRRGCPYCGHLEARELARVLTNDANEGTAPTVAITLTTVDPSTSLKTFRVGVASVVQRLRRRFGSVEYFLKIEFTTGKGARSGGHRRMHAHLLLKGVPTDVLAAVERMVRETWEGVTGAYVVEVAELRTVGGAIGYLGLHHAKLEQAPPPGWEGQAVRWSENYLGGVRVAAARARARRELASERMRWTIEREADADGLSDEWIDEEHERRMRLRTASSEGLWRRLRLHPSPNPASRPDPAPEPASGRAGLRVAHPRGRRGLGALPAASLALAELSGAVVVGPARDKPGVGPPDPLSRAVWRDGPGPP